MDDDLEFAGGLGDDGLGLDDNWADEGVGDWNAFEWHIRNERIEIERVIVEHALMIPAICDLFKRQSGNDTHPRQVGLTDTSQVICRS